MKEVVTVMVTRDVQNVKCFCKGMETDVLVAAVFLGKPHNTMSKGKLRLKQEIC
jgi:hypothetical protein